MKVKNFIVGLLQMGWSIILHGSFTYLICLVFALSLDIGLGIGTTESHFMFALRLSALWYGIFLVLNHFRQNLSVK